MYDHDQVVGGQLSSVVELRALPVGTIVGQVGEKGKVKHVKPGIFEYHCHFLRNQYLVNPVL